MDKNLEEMIADLGWIKIHATYVKKTSHDSPKLVQASLSQIIELADKIYQRLTKTN